MKRKTILVCDDHPIFRSGIIHCLKADLPDVEIVGEASNGESCISKLLLFEPDVLITDLSLPGMSGFEVIEWASKHQPGLGVYVVSMYSDIDSVRWAKEIGARGFIAKQDAQSELHAAITGSPDAFFTSESIGRGETNSPEFHAPTEPVKKLQLVSSAEMKVLKMLTRSMMSKEIARELGLSIRTVESHRANLADKLGLKGPNRLLEFAITHRDLIVK